MDNLMQASYIEGLAGGDQKCHKRRGFARLFGSMREVDFDARGTLFANISSDAAEECSRGL